MTKIRIGHVQKQVRRALITAEKPVRIADLLPYCYPRVERFELWHRGCVHRAAKRFAVVIGRDAKGNVWGPNDELARLIDGSETPPP